MFDLNVKADQKLMIETVYDEKSSARLVDVFNIRYGKRQHKYGNQVNQ